MGLSQKSWEMTSMLELCTDCGWTNQNLMMKYVVFFNAVLMRDGCGTHNKSSRVQIVWMHDLELIQGWGGGEGEGCAMEHRLLLQQLLTGPVSAAMSGYVNRASSHCGIVLISQ